MTGEFRQYLFPHDHPRLAEVRGLDAYAYRDVARTPGTFTGDLVAGWTPLYLQRVSRHHRERHAARGRPSASSPARPGEEAPVAEMVDGGAGSAGVARRRRPGPPDRHPVDAVRVADLGQPGVHAVRHRAAAGVPAHRRSATAALALMRASLSPEGYELAHTMMLINGFLGEIVGLETVLNEFSYNIALYGDARPARAVGMAALRPPLRGQLPRRRRPDGALAGVPRRRTQRDRRAARTPASTVVHRADRAGHRADGRAAGRSAQRGHRLRADGRPGDAARPGASRRRAAPGRRVPGQPDHPDRGHPRSATCPLPHRTW